MSSLRNAVNRRVHRERAQPLERQRFGLLEKAKRGKANLASSSAPRTRCAEHFENFGGLISCFPKRLKDRKLREQDHNRKKKTLKALRAKAAERNEDEFFFGMMSRKGPQGVLSKGRRWNGTVDGDRGNRALSVDEVRLLKTQDVGYVRTVRNTAAKEVRALEERVVGMGGSLDAKVVDPADEEDDDDDDWLDDEGPARKKPKKIVFADGVEDREDRISGALDGGEDDDDDDDSMNGEDSAKSNPERARAEQRERLLLKLQRRLATARKRLKALSTAENELEMQRAKMAKTQTVGGVTKTGKKFKVRERKR